MRLPPRVTPALLVAAGALAAVIGGLSAAPVSAQKSLVIERLHSDIEVHATGDITVTESIRARFSGQWNGIARRLDLQHTTAAGDRELLDVELVGASDEEGLALRTEMNRLDRATREIRIWVHDARDRTAEVELRYRVRGALRYFLADSSVAGDTGPFDELYWQVTGTDWEVPIEEASASVALPAGAEPLRAAAYRGGPDSGERVEVAMPGGGTAVGPNEVVIPSSGRLSPGEGLTVAVAWPAGQVAVPGGVARSAPVRFGPDGSVVRSDPGLVDLGRASYWALLPLLLPFLVFWLTYRVWERRGRDPRERAITVHWEPPEELDPAEAGTLVDHTPGMQDVISILVDLAVRGYVVIAERKKKGFLGFGTDYAFHLVRPRSEWGDLVRHERLFLDGLFDSTSKTEVMANLAEEGSFLDGVLETVGGEPASDTAPEGTLDSIFLSDLQNQFYKEIPGIKNALLDSLVEKGHYLRRPDRVRMLWALGAGGMFVLSFAAVPAFAMGTATGFALGLATLFATGASAIILAVFAWLMAARTEKGARTREAALGFKRFLERVESPRYRRMITSPAQFEQYLPYAMAFGCADKWAKAFDDLLTEPPDWYRGRHGRFVPTDFASDLGTLASTASSTMASSPSSSGSSGGGSVGGGSGGGGGGGF